MNGPEMFAIVINEAEVEKNQGFLVFKYFYAELI